MFDFWRLFPVSSWRLRDVSSRSRRRLHQLRRHRRDYFFPRLGRSLRDVSETCWRPMRLRRRCDDDAATSPRCCLTHLRDGWRRRRNRRRFGDVAAFAATRRLCQCDRPFKNMFMFESLWYMGSFVRYRKLAYCIRLQQKKKKNILVLMSQSAAGILVCLF